MRVGPRVEAGWRAAGAAVEDERELVVVMWVAGAAAVARMEMPARTVATAAARAAAWAAEMMVATAVWRVGTCTCRHCRQRHT